jgi:hypothetical protein
MRRLLQVLGALLLLAALAAGGLVLAVRHPGPPSGTSGPEADQVAHALERAINLDSWKATGAIQFSNGSRHILWDKKRNLARVEWRGKKVLLDVGKKSGRAFEEGQEASGQARAQLVDKAWKIFINDSFWLNPLAKLFDDGVTRSAARVDDQDALIVSYASGGATPGDSYVWLLNGQDGRPRAWRMYVSILPVAGIEATWENWTLLSTGAYVATTHLVLGMPLVRLTNVEAGAKLSDLVPEDPFTSLERDRDPLIP